MGNEPLNEIRAIGFDVDGTLYHSPPEMSGYIGRELIKITAEMLGKDPTEIEEEYLRRRDVYRSNTMTLNSFGLSGEEIFQQIWDEMPLERFVKKDLQLASGLKKLSAKYRLFILSNGAGRQIKRKLKYLGIELSLFDPMIACYDHEWVKPEPAPFLYAAEKLGLKPEEILYVGDRKDVDVEAAQAVGMKAAYVGGEDASAEVSCETIEELLRVLI